jgi:hypothetical protein
MALFFIFYLKNKLKKFFVLPRLPSNEKNSSDHHNSYTKGPNLAFFSFIESPSNSLLTINSLKIILHLLITATCSILAKAKIWPLRTLGVKFTFPIFFVELLHATIWVKLPKE